MRTVWRPAHPPPSLLGQVSQPLSPVASNDASNTGSSRQHRAQNWSVNRCVVSRSRTFVRRLQTPWGAAPRRLLRSLHLVVQRWLLNGAIFHTVKGRTPKSSLVHSSVALNSQGWVDRRVRGVGSSTGHTIRAGRLSCPTPARPTDRTDGHGAALAADKRHEVATPQQRRTHHHDAPRRSPEAHVARSFGLPHQARDRRWLVEGEVALLHRAVTLRTVHTFLLSPTGL